MAWTGHLSQEPEPIKLVGGRAGAETVPSGRGSPFGGSSCIGWADVLQNSRALWEMSGYFNVGLDYAIALHDIDRLWHCVGSCHR